MRSKNIQFHGTVEQVLAWGAWAVMTGLMATGLLLRDVLTWGTFGLAMSAIAATLHIRCFCIRVDQHMQAAFDLGREAGRFQVASHPTRFGRD